MGLLQQRHGSRYVGAGLAAARHRDVAQGIVVAAIDAHSWDQEVRLHPEVDQFYLKTSEGGVIPYR